MTLGNSYVTSHYLSHGLTACGRKRAFIQGFVAIDEKEWFRTHIRES